LTLRLSDIEDLRELEPGALKGTLRVLGVLFHAQFVRVKYAGILGEETEAGHGEQKPWNDDPESLCNTWWYQTVVHVDECRFATIEVPGFDGVYVLLIYPSEL